MAEANVPPRFKVAMLMFDGVDVLDFAGPLEMFSYMSYNHETGRKEPGFSVQFIAQSEIITTSTDLRVLRDSSIEQATAEACTFDILLVPGGPPEVIAPLWQTETPELIFVRHFAALPQIVNTQPRILFSVCTGALLLGKAGVFAGVTATTHHMFLDQLREACSQSGTLATQVVEARYIDAGITKAGVRVISSGGVSSGLDAACHLISTEWSNEKALFATKLAECNWRKPVEN